MIVGAPFRRSGIRIANRQRIVKTRPMRDLSPVRPPIRTVTTKNMIRITARAVILLNSYTTAVWSPLEYVEISKMTPSPSLRGLPKSGPV